MQVAFGDCPQVLLPCLGQPSSFPSAGCTNTLGCKPQTASEVLEKEETEPNLVPSKSGMLWESSMGDGGSATHQSQPRGHLPSEHLWRAPSQAFLGHTARGFLMALRFLEGLLPAGKRVSPRSPQAHRQSFGHSRCQLCPCLCLQSPVLNLKDEFCRA